MRSDSVLLLLLVVGVATLLGKVLVPIARAYARRLEAGAPSGDLADLQERVAELERRESRVAELEERVDFAERLLAQQRDREPGRLPGG